MFKKIWLKLNEPEVVQEIRDIGDVLQIALPVVALVVLGLTQSLNLFWPLALSVGLAQLVVEILKKSFNLTPWGKRPDGHDNGFPSGHVAGAFSGSWFFYFVYGWEIAVIPLALGAFTALSRVLPEKHSPIQVTVSVILTYFISGYFLG